MSYQGLSSALPQTTTTSSGQTIPTLLPAGPSIYSSNTGASSNNSGSAIQTTTGNPVLTTSTSSGSPTTSPAKTTSSTSTTPKTTTPNISNGGFLDFLIAVVAMILVLQAHKLAKSFLDHLFPGGGGGHGPGALVSGLMEGAGIAVGESIFKGGKGLAKTGASMGGSAAVGGLAAAHKHVKASGGNVFGKDGILGGIKKASSQKALPPDQGIRMDGPKGFTMGASTGAGTQTTMSGGSSTGQTGSGASWMSFGPKVNHDGKHRSASGLFDSQSFQNGAHTQLRPSAQSKLDELSKFSNSKPTVGGILNAFGQGAQERFKADALHKASGKKGYAGGTKSLLGVATQEFGQQKDQAIESQAIRDSYVPSKQLLDAAGQQDPLALSDLGQIGHHQSQMDEGVQWIEQGQTLQQALQPEYDQSMADYDQTSQEVDGLGLMLDGYRANGQTNTPEFQKSEANYEAAKVRRQSAEEKFGLRQSQMKQAQSMVDRGEQRVIASQNAISKINMGWYSQSLRNSPRMVQVAQTRANRKGLSDLGQVPSARKGRRS